MERRAERAGRSIANAIGNQIRDGVVSATASIRFLDREIRNLSSSNVRIDIDVDNAALAAAATNLRAVGNAIRNLQTHLAALDENRLIRMRAALAAFSNASDGIRNIAAAFRVLVKAIDKLDENKLLRLRLLFNNLANSAAFARLERVIENVRRALEALAVIVRILGPLLARMGRQGERAFKGINDEARDLLRTLLQLNFVRFLGTFAKFASVATAAAAGIALLGGALAGLVPVVVALVSALAAASNALLALPAAGAALVAIFGTLKAATAGVGDALGAVADGDAKKLDEALRKLSPSARSFVLAVRDIKPAFDKMQLGVQERLFKGLGDRVRLVATALLPQLGAGFQKLGTDLNSMARSVLDFGRSSSAIFGLKAAFDVANTALIAFDDAVKPALVSLSNLVQAGAGPAREAFTALGNAVTGFFERLSSRSIESLEAQIRSGVDVAKQLGSVLGNVGQIIGDVFAAAAQAPGGLLGNLERLTGEFAKFTASDSGQQAIINIFTTLSELGRATAPVLLELARIIGSTVAPALGDLIRIVGPALQPVVQALGVGLKALQPAIAPLAEGFAAVLRGVAPILPVLGQLAGLVARVLGVALTNLANVLGPVIAKLSPSFAKVIETLATAFAAVAPSIAEFAAGLGTALTTAVTPLAEMLPKLADAFIKDLLPRLPELTAAFLGLIPAIQLAAELFAEGLADALTQLIPVMPQLVDAFVAFALAAANMATAIIPLLPIVAKLFSIMVRFIPIGAQIAAVLVGVLAGAINIVANTIKGVTGFLDSAAVSFRGFIEGLPEKFEAFKETVTNAFNTVVDFVTGIPGKIGSAIAAIPDILIGTFKRAIDGAFFAIGVGIGLILTAVLILPGQIADFLRSLPARLSALFTSAWNGAVTATTNLGNRILAFVGNMVIRIGNFVQRIPAILSGAFRSAFAQAQNIVNSAISRIMSAIGSIPSRISSLGGRFAAAGRGIIDAIGRGISSAGGFASDLGNRIASNIRGAINSVISSINNGIASIDSAFPGDLPRLPQLANGGIFDRPLVAQIAESGREVVVPMTRPERALQLAQDSGLADLIRRSEGRSQVIHVEIHAGNVRDPMAIAMMTVNQVAAAVGA